MRRRTLRARNRNIGASRGAALSTGVLDPSTLSNLILLARIGADRAAGRLWQDGGATVPAVAHNDLVRIAQMQYGVSLDAPADSNRMTLTLDAGGIWSLATGADADNYYLGAPSGLPFGTGDFHAWAWAYWATVPAGFANIVSLSTDSTGDWVMYLNNGNFEVFEAAGTLMAGSGPSNATWALFQFWRSAGAAFAQINTSTPVSQASTTDFTEIEYRFGAWQIASAVDGTRIAQTGLRTVAPTAAERAALYAAGPGA